MRRGANDTNTALMEIDALQQHGDKKCHTCGRFGHLAKDCWQNKSKSKGKDSKGKSGKKGKGKGKGKTDKDVCLKCGQRGHWAKNCPNPAKAIHELDGAERCQTTAGGSGTMAKSGRHRRIRAQLRVSVLRRLSLWPKPEAAMGGLWLASLTAGAAEYPRVQGLARRMTDCQRNLVVNLGQKDLALRGPTGRSFARVTVASIAKNLLSVSSLLKTGHEVVFSSGKSYIRQSEDRCAAADGATTSLLTL